jgi:hypothetical protein
MENVENVPTETNTPPPVTPDKPADKPAETLRESLEKNFVKSSAPTNGTPEDPAANKSFVNGENQQAAPAAATKDTIVAPASMNAAEKKFFATLPTEAKKFISRREYELRSEFGRQTQGLTQKEKEVSDVASAVTPEVREEYARQGIAVPDLVRRSIAWDKRVKEGVGGFLEFGEAHGYTPQDIVAFLSNGHQPEQPQYLTKEEAEALAEEKVQKQFELYQQSGIAESNAKALQSFLDSKPVFKGDPGTAAQVENAVAEEIEYLKFRGFRGTTAELLETSYQRALSNNEALSSLRAPAPQPAKPENIYEQMERVRAAKAASKSASGSLGSGSPVQKSSSLRESLERNWAKSG